jgi:SAM-dependent methyltransferase
MNSKILNLGCGKDYVEGAINVDFFASHVDVRHDLNVFPYPFADNEFDEIKCMNVVEHLDDVIRTMEELHRIGKPGCRLTIRVPHFRSACLYEDLTHKHGFAWRSFDIFVDCGLYGEYSNARFLYEHRSYTPYKVPGLYRLLSRFPLATDHLLSKFVPMASILFIMKVSK